MFNMRTNYSISNLVSSVTAVYNSLILNSFILHIFFRILFLFPNDIFCHCCFCNNHVDAITVLWKKVSHFFILSLDDGKWVQLFTEICATIYGNTA